jgi:clan AA aspartic protease (TIGR02281 family)
MTSHRERLLPLAALLLLAAGPAPDSPEACTLQHRGEAAVTLDGAAPLVQVTIDGKPATLVLDTGATTTLLTDDAVQRLGLQTRQIGTATVQGVGGESKAVVVQVKRLQLGNVMLTDQPIIIASFPLRGYHGAAPDGLLGASTLEKFDVDIDLPHGKLGLYAARNCVSGTPDWTEPHILKADDTYAPRPNLVYLQVLLDDTPIYAVVDTGASISFVDARAAQAAGTTSEALREVKPDLVHGAAPQDAEVRRHQFRSLTIGLENYNHPMLTIGDLAPGIGGMLLGVDYARTHRLWISYASRRVFVGERTIARP